MDDIDNIVDNIYRNDDITKRPGYLLDENFRHIEEAIKDYRGRGVGSICHDNGWRKSLLTIEDISLCVAAELKSEAIKAPWAVGYKSLYALYHTPTLRGRLDLSACLNVDQSILSQPIENIQRVVCSKIKKIIKGIAYSDTECVNIFQVFIPIGLIKAFQKRYTIIGYVYETKVQEYNDDWMELAEKWDNLSYSLFVLMPDDELSRAWKMYGQNFKQRLLDYKFKHITCKDCDNQGKLFRERLAKLLLDTLKDPVCGDLSEKAEAKAAFLVYQTIVNLKERGVSSISNKWQDFLTSIRSNSERIIEVLTNADGLDFTVDTQIEIIDEAYRLRKKTERDFMPLLKISSEWKSPDEMKKVRYNDPIDTALCVSGFSMEEVIEFSKAFDSAVREVREAREKEYERINAQTIQQEEFQRTQLEAQKEQARAMNRQTTALIDAQIAQLKLQMADLKRQALSIPFGSLEWGNLNSAQAQLSRDIAKLEAMKK